MAALLWSMWKHRNVKVWEDITETCATVVDRAWSMVEDWQLVNAHCVNGQVVSIVVHTTAVAAHAYPADAADVLVCWKAPAQGRLKCNIGAAFSDLHNRTDIGIYLG